MRHPNKILINRKSIVWLVYFLRGCGVQDARCINEYPSFFRIEFSQPNFHYIKQVRRWICCWKVFHLLFSVVAIFARLCALFRNAHHPQFIRWNGAVRFSCVCFVFFLIKRVIVISNTNFSYSEAAKSFLFKALNALTLSINCYSVSSTTGHLSRWRESGSWANLDHLWLRQSPFRRRISAK